MHAQVMHTLKFVTGSVVIAERQALQHVHTRDSTLSPMAHSVHQYMQLVIHLVRL